MKKTRLFILSALAVVSLAGCGGDTATKVDLTTEEGQTALKTSAKEAAKAYSKGDITGIGAELTVSNGNLSITGDVEMGKDTKLNNLELGLKNFSNTTTIAMKKAGNSIEAALTDNLSGNLVAKADLTYKPDAEVKTAKIDETLNASNVSAGSYFKDNTAYIDYSSAGIRNLLKDASDLVNREVKNLVPEAEMEDFDFNKMLDDATGMPGRKVKVANPGEAPAFPEIKYEYTADTEKAIDEALDSYILKEEALRDMLTFTTYSSGKFELGINVTLDKVTNLLKAVEKLVPEGSQAAAILPMVETLLPTIFTKLNADLDFTFNKEGFLIEEKLDLDLALTTKPVESYIPLLAYMVPQLSFLSEVTKFDLTITASVSEKLTLTYNDDVKVNFPSDLDSYQTAKAE